MQSVVLRIDELQFQTKEAYKTLRSNIEFSGDDMRVIAITSSMPNEGKSEVSYELAASFAENGAKVLLIDADMRKSVLQSRVLKGEIQNGLSNCLVGKCQADDAMCETNLENLYIIFAGPSTPTPSELLGSERFTRLLQGAKRRFDYVIIDTPPIGSVIDSAIVGGKSDGTVLVVGSGKISYRMAQDSLRQLYAANCRMIGCVLNNIKMGSSGYGRGKYYSSYYYRYYNYYRGYYGK